MREAVIVLAIIVCSGCAPAMDWPWYVCTTKGEYLLCAPAHPSQADKNTIVPKPADTKKHEKIDPDHSA